MLDPIATERAEKEIDRFINSRSKAKAEANLVAALERREDDRKLAAVREENRALWIAHFRRRAACNLAAARNYRTRARALETEGDAA